MNEPADIAVVGAGAAGLMAAIWAGRTLKGAGRIVALDGVKKLGAKILVAGGGRCNVTHFAVDEMAYAGSSRHAIKKVLRRFDVPKTVEFFREFGVELKREETGKLFPTTDDAHTVLNALLRACAESRVELVHPWRVEGIERSSNGFLIRRSESASEAPPDALPSLLAASRIILATGGMALPRSGSDGKGYEIARALGHTTTPRIFPALVPLLLDASCPLRELSGIAAPATLEVRSGTGKRLASFTNSVLCTHFGLSGPGVLDISRHLMDERSRDAEAGLVANWVPNVRGEDLDARLTNLKNQSPVAFIQGRLGLPERMARTIAAMAGIDGGAPGHQLTREGRRSLVRMLTEMPLPVTGDRGFTHAEVTAGGVPLSEVRLETMESRVCPGLYLCGEILDVDGRIGGFNFQWAWASGFVAGSSAAEEGIHHGGTKDTQGKRG